MRWGHLLKQHLMPLCLITWPILMQNVFHAFFHKSWSRKTLNHCTEFCQRVFTAIWKIANNDVFNFALRYHKDIDDWVIYHLTDVCEMCRRSLNHFLWINIVPCGVAVDVNVNFDTWIAWQRQMCGWLFLRQNVKIVNLSISHDYLVPSSSFNKSRSSGNSNSNFGSVISNFGLSLHQLDGTAAQSLRFL